MPNEAQNHSEGVQSLSPCVLAMNPIPVALQFHRQPLLHAGDWRYCDARASALLRPALR